MYNQQTSNKTRDLVGGTVTAWICVLIFTLGMLVSHSLIYFTLGSSLVAVFWSLRLLMSTRNDRKES